MLTLHYCFFFLVDCAPDVYWREYIDGVIPQDAIAAEPGVYIGQMPVNGILPGTLYPSRKVVVSEYFAKKAEATEALKVNIILRS